MSPKMGYMPFVCVCVYVCVCVFEHVLICVHAFCSQMNVISILMQQQSCWWNILVEALMVVLLSFHILRLRVGIVKVLLVCVCVCMCVGVGVSVCVFVCYDISLIISDEAVCDLRAWSIISAPAH